MIKLAILGNYATQFFVKSLKSSGKKLELSMEVYEADFNAIDFEIIDNESGLYRFNPDYIIMHESDLALRDEFYSLEENDKKEFAHNKSKILASRVTLLSDRLPKCKILYPSLFVENDQIFGNYYGKVNSSWFYQISKLSWKTLEISDENSSLYLVDSNNPHSTHLSRDWTQIVNAELHFTPNYLNWLASRIITFIHSFQGVFKKCVILDLDNTLWGGIIGDDGMEGIEIGNLGMGKAFTRLQKWLKQLKNRGILLAVCSKNELNIAQEPFLNHPEMILKLDDFAVFIANWESKADNINQIQKILNIGFDSFVFIDDNPAEREMVRKHLPQICVPELPEDAAEYLPFLISQNLFETTTYSLNDENRTKQYQEESKRVALAHSITDMEEYLISLEMTAQINSFKAMDYERIAQLTQRSNQFNLRTIRYSLNEIENIAANLNFITFSVTMCDKFGSYGLISIMIIELKSKEAFIDTWIMSCRVLKRTVEKMILSCAMRKLLDLGFKNLIGEYIPTPKNNIVSSLLPSLGFKEMENESNKYILDLTTANLQETKIKYDYTSD
jgi:FkbH-like protein